MNYSNSSFVKNISTFIIMILFSPTLLFSQTKDTTAPSNPISISGLVDVNFNENFNNPLSRTNGYRAFDVNENQFNLNEAKVVIQKAASPVGFRIDLAYGETMDVVNSSANITAEQSLKNVEQAYLTAVIPIGSGLTINAGKMVTHMGGETIKSISNINYSRSFLFTYAIPLWHMGASAAYTFSPEFSSTLYIYNGWNNAIDNNTDKTLGAQIVWTPSSVFSFTENFIGGAEEPDAIYKRYVFDSIFNLQATDALFITLNADYGQESNSPVGYASWNGAALTGKYNIQ